jgi:hypothetical protein
MAATVGRPLRVIQWSSGNAGRNALRGIVRHPDLELVGVHAHSPEKQGRDAAELCGLDAPTGVHATNDVDALLGLDADCVVYMAQGETRVHETLEDLTRILRAGIDVVNTYEDPGFTGVFFGYGRPLDYDAPLLRPGMLKGGWGCMVLMLADALGVSLEEIREEHERLPAPDTFETKMGKIEQGTCAGVRFEVQGIVGGRPALVAAHVNRLRQDIGPEWDRLSGTKHSGYKIEVVGSPSLTCEIEPVGEDGDHNTAGILGTAMRVVNAIPTVCAHAPGVVSTLDLPIFTARGVAGHIR